MMRQRPRLKFVVAVLLLWQAASAGVGMASAAAQPVAVMDSAIAGIHCSAHGHDTAAVPSASGSNLVTATCHHPAGPGCCDAGVVCHGLCAHGAVALLPQAFAHGQGAPARQPVFELRAAAEPRHPAEVFRPPI
jgi:hypothetical protein